MVELTQIVKSLTSTPYVIKLVKNLVCKSMWDVLTFLFKSVAALQFSLFECYSITDRSNFKNILLAVY